jgi:F-type H+-transporting ATPase subunit b
MLDFSVTFIITIINIIILFFILKAILFKPVTKFMAERAKRVQDTIDRAEKDKADARILLNQYESKIKNLEGEAKEILRAARENAECEAQQIIAGGNAEAANILANTRRQLETEKQAALAKFQTEAAVLVMEASSKLIARELTGEDNMRYANMLIDELAAKKGNN